MILASAGSTFPLNELAELADKVTEVAVPSVALDTSHPLTAEFEQLCSEVARLQESIFSIAYTSISLISALVGATWCLTSTLGDTESVTTELMAEWRHEHRWCR